MVGETFDRQIRVQRHPMEVDHVVEEQSIEHHGLLAVVTLRQSLDDGAVGPG